MGAIENHNIYGLTIRESADDGSDFSTPSADYRRLFLGEDGQLHLKDSSGTVTDIGGGGGGDITADAAWAAKGDLIVATGNDAAAVLTAGANGKVPTYASGEATGILPSFPPGHELDYVEKTSATSITATAEASADTVVTANAVTLDGSTAIWVEFYADNCRPRSDAAGTLSLWLYDGASSIGRLGLLTGPAAAADNKPTTVKRKLTPSNAAHTYSIRATVNGGTGSVGGGAGGSGNAMPSYVRITVA